uniref:Uncharacterized protein n=1 Tax=Timema bartmani TaxID=61472 RepID=A0A7R9F5J6_9NEOP|nr:unnamed protein product [Timema bartmani]
MKLWLDTNRIAYEDQMMKNESDSEDGSDSNNTSTSSSYGSNTDGQIPGVEDLADDKLERHALVLDNVNLCGLGVKGTPQDPMFVGSSEASKILTGQGAWSYGASWKILRYLTWGEGGGAGVENDDKRPNGVTRNAPACQSSLNYSSLWKLEMMTVRACTHHFKYFLHHVGGHAHTLAFFLLPFLLYFSLCAPS